MGTTNQHETTTLDVQGMTCGSCEQRVSSALAGVPGVEHATVSRAAGQATISFDPAITTPAVLADAVSAAGYPARAVTATGASATQAGGSSKPGCSCCAA